MHLIEEMREQYEELGRKDIGFVTMEYVKDHPVLHLYVWSKHLENHYKYFVISAKEMMSSEDAEFFRALCKKRVRLNQQAIQEIYNFYVEEYPEICLRPYKSGMHMLHHIYCTLHESLEELLYKADLGFLALFLNEIDDYNMIGTNPSAVFDGLPINVLRVLNTKQGIMALRTEKQREVMYSLYLKEFQVFRRSWSIGQCEYFTKVICERNEEGFFWEDGRILDYLLSHRTRKDYLKLMNYKRKVTALNGLAALPVVPFLGGNCYEDFFYKADYLYEILVKDAFEWDLAYAIAYANGGQALEYEDENYLIRFPQTALDVCKESEKQHSCLWNYIKKVAEGETIILFMRKASDPEKSFITVEVYNGFILQARSRYNGMIGEQELEWLEQYANKKNLIFDREEMV